MSVISGAVKLYSKPTDEDIPVSDLKIARHYLDSTILSLSLIPGHTYKIDGLYKLFYGNATISVYSGGGTDTSHTINKPSDQKYERFPTLTFVAGDEVINNNLNIYIEVSNLPSDSYIILDNISIREAIYYDEENIDVIYP